MQSVTHFGIEQQENLKLQQQILKMSLYASVDLRHEVIVHLRTK